VAGVLTTPTTETLHKDAVPPEIDKFSQHQALTVIKTPEELMYNA
jgi:hypothetical protein